MCGVYRARQPSGRLKRRSTGPLSQTLREPHGSAIPDYPGHSPYPGKPVYPGLLPYVTLPNRDLPLAGRLPGDHLLTLG
jgi:hypothetical protein